MRGSRWPEVLLRGVRVWRDGAVRTRAALVGYWCPPLLRRRAVGARYHDMPPCKVIRREALDRLELTDMGHGFTIEMLLKAHRAGLEVVEVPVRCRARSAGESKVSGTLVGSARAAAKILTTVARHAMLARRKTRG